MKVPDDRTRRRWRGVLLAGIAVLQAGCATWFGSWDSGLPKDELPTEDRLWHIVFPLSVAAAEHCVFKREETYGFFLESMADRAADAGTESGHRPARVRYVHAQLPAGKAGMAIGDSIIAINGSSVVAQSAESIRSQIERLTRAKIQPLSLRLARSGREYDIDLWAVPSCRMQVKVVESSVINALSDGSHIVVTSALLQFVRSPDQLAWVLAHEVGHHVLEHTELQQLQLVLNQFLASTIGEKPLALRQIDLERQADLYAADLMVRAGFDVRDARTLLMRIQALQGNGMGQTHPSTQERLEGLDRILQTLDRQAAR